MEILNHLAEGYAVAVTLDNLFYAFVGCLLGTLVGVLPGLGPAASIAILLPFTFGLEPTSSLIMLAGIYYGAQYGGSVTAILLNLPGETSAVVTTLDGYQLARQGRGGLALAIAALASFFAGTVATVVLAGFSLPLVEFALKFQSPEYFALMVFGLMGAAAIGTSSFVKTLSMISLGLLIGLAGIDLNSGTPRFTFGSPLLLDGIEFVALAVGLFALAEIIVTLSEGEEGRSGMQRITSLMPRWRDIREIFPATVRGTLIGIVTGILPGAGASIASFISYAVEKRVAKNPDDFGKGALAGVASPEAANNAAAQLAFAPTLALGIPGSGTMALILAALMIHGIQPGPDIIRSNPGMFWGLIVSMWIGNVILLIINLPMLRLWVKALMLPYRFLYPAILAFSLIGVYSVSSSTFMIFTAALFGLLGYLFYKLRCEPVPLVLGFVLGPMMEENFRRSLIISGGDFSIFVSHPISLTLLCMSAALVLFVLISGARRRRRVASAEGA